MEEIETLFGYAQHVAAALVRSLAKRRMSSDDKRAIIYYCELIVEKIKGLD